MERESISTITTKNQTTVPKQVRETLSLEPGDKIRYLIDANGLVHIVKAEPVSNMWQTAYAQEKKYGSFDTAEPNWGADIESEEFD
ncbi:type II toxin-antitoxin system PrlF family antitoxin [Limosilactobacillus reuteri]|uniref:type II toxin-antitoxin system PrlF family antitoxin n=1 Tax=Limosilactobacillus reuteri TaxID=1598 RepID=UPI001E3CCA63|nr:type II toxin-antitoxin system PrlF family antitoxin [Limosilactobacillus reuteri]MCC4485928.1 type II toxin-antitoxin system PrlF family antitoxin [Limosilactobacillus reuteri]